MTLANYQIDISCFTMCLTTLHNSWEIGNVLVDVYVLIHTCLYPYILFIYIQIHIERTEIVLMFLNSMVFKEEIMNVCLLCDNQTENVLSI